MDTTTTPHLPQEDKYIFTEGINYHTTGNESIWGSEDDITVQAIESSSVHGRWLNVCAGDGRFSARLLQKVDDVVAFDIDESALSKLEAVTPQELRKKLTIQSGNVTDRFPFEDGLFDGVFCTGTLHLFPEKVLRHITTEIDRVLCSGGSIILDYATDIRRERPDGSLYTVKDEPSLTLEKGIALLKSCFPSFQTNITTASIPPEEVIISPEHRYVFRSNLLLITGKKLGS